MHNICSINLKVLFIGVNLIRTVPMLCHLAETIAMDEYWIHWQLDGSVHVYCLAMAEKQWFSVTSKWIHSTLSLQYFHGNCNAVITIIRISQSTWLKLIQVGPEIPIHERGTERPGKCLERKVSIWVAVWPLVLRLYWEFWRKEPQWNWKWKVSHVNENWFLFP